MTMFDLVSTTLQEQNVDPSNKDQRVDFWHQSWHNIENINAIIMMDTCINA